jgi:hypothetical protein
MWKGGRRDASGSKWFGGDVGDLSLVEAALGNRNKPHDLFQLPKRKSIERG